MAKARQRTFRRSDRILVFVVNEGNSYEVMDSSGSSQVLIPSDVVVDMPGSRRTMRLLDFVLMREEMGWVAGDKVGPCVEYHREQIRKLTIGEKDPDFVELEVDGKLVTTPDGSRAKDFALSGALEELRKEGFIEVFEA